MAVQINGTTGITTPKLDALDLELGSKNVVESGSNANGEYVRFADGTQICLKKITASRTLTSSAGALFFTGTVLQAGAFPATFSAAPWVSITILGSEAAFVEMTGAGLTTSIGPAYYHLSDASRSSSQSYTDHIVAIGRWY